MNKPTEYKLVRDRIPEIIKKSGREPDIVKIRDKQVYKEYLMEKLNEEVEELHNAVASNNQPDIAGELADVFEVLQAISEMCRTASIIDIAAEKLHHRGGFTQGYLLRIDK